MNMSSLGKETRGVHGRNQNMCVKGMKLGTWQVFSGNVWKMGLEDDSARFYKANIYVLRK